MRKDSIQNIFSQLSLLYLNVRWTDTCQCYDYGMHRLRTARIDFQPSILHCAMNYTLFRWSSYKLQLLSRWLYILPYDLILGSKDSTVYLTALGRPPPNTTVSQPNDSFHIRFIGDCHHPSHCGFESTIQLRLWRISWQPFSGDPRAIFGLKIDLSSTSSF